MFRLTAYHIFLKFRSVLLDYARSSSATKVAWLLVLCCALCRFGARDLMRIFISSQDCNILRDDKWRAIRFYVASNWNDDLITWYVCIANAKCLQFVFRNWRRVDDDLHLECFVQQRRAIVWNSCNSSKLKFCLLHKNIFELRKLYVKTVCSTSRY